MVLFLPPRHKCGRRPRLIGAFCQRKERRIFALDLPTRWRWKTAPLLIYTCTGRLDRMSHTKWRKTKKQSSKTRSGHQISCCLVSLLLLCDILSGCPVFRVMSGKETKRRKLGPGASRLNTRLGRAGRGAWEPVLDCIVGPTVNFGFFHVPMLAYNACSPVGHL